MRIRSIKPEVHLDEELWDLEQSTHLPVFRGFTGLWGAADREGRFEWRPRKLKTRILPYWEGDFETVMSALSDAGFLSKYEVLGRPYGVVRTFTKHQVVNQREAKSVLPPPPEHVQSDADTCTHVQERQEGNRKGTGTGTVTACAGATGLLEFEPRSGFNSKDVETLFSQLRSARVGGGKFKAQRSDYDRSQSAVEWAHEQNPSDPASAASASISKFLEHAEGREAAGWPFWAWANDPGRWFAYLPESAGNSGQRRASGGMAPVITQAEVEEAAAKPKPAWLTRELPEDAQ